MNIPYRALKFFRNTAHRDALGDLFPDSIFFTIGECRHPSGIPGILGSFDDSPASGPGIIHGLFFRLESGYKGQAFLDEVSEPYFTGICFIRHLFPPPVWIPAAGLPDILSLFRNKCGGIYSHRQSCRRNTACPVPVFYP